MDKRKIWHGIKRRLRWLENPANILISIGVLFGSIYFFRWMGLKGFLGIFIGMVLMAYIFASKNMLVLWILDKFSAGAFHDEVFKNEKR